MLAHRRLLLGTAVLCLALLVAAMVPGPAAADKWIGTDEKVERLVAEMGGPEPKEPLLNTDQGDLLLFFFALGGFASGVLVGYNWHRLFGPGKGVAK